MRVKTLLMVSLIGSSIIVGSGCAKQELVKKEEPVPAPAPVAQPTPPVQQPETIQPVKQEPMESQPVPVVTEQPKAVEEKVKVELADIYFAFDSYTLDAAARDMLFKSSEILKKNGNVKIRIEGNTDERGSDEYNLALGEKRAKAALQYLVTLGVPEKNLSFISYGEEKPVDPGHDEAAWSKNRRDQFLIVAD